ncbi:hypothetical protein [Streptomyces sp. AM 2-1-1]|uniref:hypothetical protein n=1 Tax=Streptomyces sp. AM 2-1-1 TaxID=3028709 RepID=UPI0023B99A80|nr:hypothetical protein [Streptomyces sp. AM 2-1-1]WEH41710.1 hypothetical protein PZB77_20655 [Streptomyces sp. AM 2-1-1]
MAGTPEALLYDTARDIGRRRAEEGGPVGSMASVLRSLENDEAELALDDLAHMIEYFRIPVHPAEYDRLVAVATALDSLDVLLEIGVDRFVDHRRPASGPAATLDPDARVKD